MYRPGLTSSGSKAGDENAQPFRERAVTTAARVSYRKFGSIRIQRDDRVRFSPWTFPELRYLNFATKGESIEVERAGRVVIYLWAPRGRLSSACLAFDLSADEIQTLMSELRSAGHGLERWIVPALEYTQATLHPLKDSITQGRQLLEIIPALLQVYRDFPVAETWKRNRANVFANAGMSPPETTAKTTRRARTTPEKANKSAKADAPARKSARKSSKTTVPRKQTAKARRA
jgi:hypothetical protein